MIYKRTWIILLLASFLMAACGISDVAESPSTVLHATPAPDWIDASETFTGVEEAQLVEAARAEGGELMFYTSINIGDLEQILEKFRERYPFTSTEYYRATGEDVIRKYMTEAQTGQHFADVFETEAFEIYRLLQADLLQPYIAPESAFYPSGEKDPDGYWTIDRINTVVIGYNTDLVDPADVPVTWEDLLDPKWQGNIGVEANDVELFADMVSVWGEEKTYTYWEGIADLEPGIVDGHTVLAELVSAGEFAISPTLFGYKIEQLKAKGAPIEWVRTDPVIAYTQLLAMAADAPHPATARLFINWLLSEEGQNVYREVGRIPNRPGIDPIPPELMEGLNLVYTVPSLAADYNSYAEKWRTMFKLD